MKLRALCLLPLTLALFSIQSTCQTVHKATLTWGASPTTGATYGVLRGLTPGGSKSKIATGVSALTFVDSPLSANTQYCYQVVAEAAGSTDSTPTNEVCGVTGKDAAQPPAGSLGVIFQ